jgi:hypothetical protein
MELHLKVIGSLLVLISLLHIGFPKRFNWKEELKTLSLINKQLMTVHTFFVAFTVLLMGVLCLVSSADLVSTRLGKQISFGLFIFWFTRFVFQFFVYSPKLWKGKPFETTAHIGFALIWLYLSVIFLLVSIH